MRILIVDDEEIMCNALYLHLKEDGFDISKAYNAREAIRIFDEKIFDLVISDLRLGDMDGTDLISELKEKDDKTVFVIMTAYGTMEKALEAGKLGVYYFITKPFSMEQIDSIVNKVKEDISLREDNRHFREILNERYSFPNIIGKNKNMEKVYKVISKVTGVDIPVLITGESGTGKELVANAIHYNSDRKDKPLIAVNCSALPDTLLESELFGYEKGAFTGAEKKRKGRFELSDGGSLFLDEIGDMPLHLQSKILRALQNKFIEPLGSSESLEVDTRIIAATNRDLEDMVEKGTFREDLYYRLKVVNIKIPPLRERKDDIPLLCRHIIEKYNKQFNKDIKGIDKEVRRFFMNYEWPGNIRELENILQHSIIFSNNELINMEDLPDDIENSDKKFAAEDDSLEALEISHIKRILSQTGHNVSKTARILKIDRKTLYNKMKKYDLQ